MVMSIHEKEETRKTQWVRYLIGIVCSSVVFSCLWGLATQDLSQALLGSTIPWIFAAACILTSISWAIIMIPLLNLTARVFGGRTNREKNLEPGDTPNPRSPSAHGFGGR